MNTLCNRNTWNFLQCKRASRLVCWVAILMMINSVVAHAGIVNGSFENGFDGWTIGTPSGSYITIYNSQYIPTDGNYDAWFSGIVESLAQVSVFSYNDIRQTFSASAGQILQVDAMNSSSTYASPPNGNAEVNIYFNVSGNNYFEYVHLSGNTSWTTLSFPPFPTTGEYQIDCAVGANAIPGGEGPPQSQATIDFRIDNVKLVPEPSTFVLLFAGAIGILVWTWRGRKRVNRLE